LVGASDPNGGILKTKPIMKKSTPAPDPDAYVSSLAGWRKACVEGLRSAAMRAARTEEMIKWGHLVYQSNGPVFLIRAEEHRVLFGFWRGQRLRELEPRLKPGGKYEMATIELREGDSLLPVVVRRLVESAVSLNQELGDPTDVGRK
jgi:hypothetical protein